MSSRIIRQAMAQAADSPPQFAGSDLVGTPVQHEQRCGCQHEHKSGKYIERSRSRATNMEATVAAKPTSRIDLFSVLSSDNALDENR